MIPTAGNGHHATPIKPLVVTDAEQPRVRNLGPQRPAKPDVLAKQIIHIAGFAAEFRSSFASQNILAEYTFGRTLIE